MVISNSGLFSGESGLYLAIEPPKLVKGRTFSEMALLFAALRIPSGPTEFAGLLAQVLLVGGVIFLLLLLAVVVFWRTRRTKRNRSK